MNLFLPSDWNYLWFATGWQTNSWSSTASIAKTICMASQRLTWRWARVPCVYYSAIPWNVLSSFSLMCYFVLNVVRKNLQPKYRDDYSGKILEEGISIHEIFEEVPILIHNSKLVSHACNHGNELHCELQTFLNRYYTHARRIATKFVGLFFDVYIEFCHTTRTLCRCYHTGNVQNFVLQDTWRKE